MIPFKNKKLPTRNHKLCACGCGKSGPIWSKGLLKWCWSRIHGRPIKKITEKKKLEKKIESNLKSEMHEWFNKLWDEREDANGYCYCFETGTAMPRGMYRDNSACFHHVLEKGTRKYKKHMMCEWNVIIILPDVHGSIPNNTPKINQLTAEFKEKY